MTAALDLEAEYNNRQRVPEHVEIIPRWLAQSLRTRDQLSPYKERAYGGGERHRYDLFATGRRGHTTPLVVYIHGGYWQRGDRKEYSFVARELVAKGCDVALPSYTLAPAASIGAILDELKLCLAALWRTTGRRPVVVGHSAGGHLAAALLATDWSKVPGVPDDLVRAAYAISGVFDLEPLIPTSLNPALKLDAASARAMSPLFWSPPPKDRWLIAAVGGNESREFLRQSLAIAGAWSAAGVKAECVVVPGTNHFTIVEALTDPDSPMLARIVDLARRG
jgi:arylformamidase